MKRVLYIGFMTAGIFILLFFSSNILSQLNKHQIEMQMSNDEATTYRLKEHIVERFYKAELDTTFVSAYIADRVGVEGLRPDTGKIKSELEKVVTSLFSVNNIFSNATYINTEGSEVFRLDLKGSIIKSPLNKEITEICFEHTKARKSREIFTTFDNNTIYISSPIFEDKKFLGVIVMEVNERKFLMELSPLIKNGDIILMEDTGRYILTSDKHKGKVNFIREYPNSLLTEILKKQSGNLVYENKTLLTFTPVNLDDRQWFLLLSAEKSSVTSTDSALYEKLIAIFAFTIFVIIASIILLVYSNKKEQIAKREKLQNIQLEAVNNELKEKQYSLEEQNSVIEELNSQLEDENDRNLRQKKQLEEVNEKLRQKQYDLEEQNTIIEELNSQLEDENARYQKQKEILQAIIDSINAGIMMVDLEGKVFFVNTAWRNMYNYINIEDKYNPDDDFYINNVSGFDTIEFLNNMMAGVENNQEQLSKMVELLENTNEGYSVDLEQSSPTKRFINLYSNPCISHTNNCYGRVFVVRDISHQKEVDRIKLELISTVSHELRTPMSSILGFSELLLTRKLTEERNKEYISIINSEANRLTGLINDFLDIQRMESGKQVFNKQYNSVEQIIKESLILFENAGNGYKIAINKKTEVIPDAYCDHDKILQVLSNLLSNAIKYSPNGGLINIDLLLENGNVKVIITDQGLGIPGNVKDKLFTKFFRVDNDDRRKIGGSGLGLAICKEIIKAHGGEIGVESVYGHGSTFYFTIPCSEKNNIFIITLNNEKGDRNE